MFTERLLQHFKDPKNVGELPPPAVTVEVSNPACGDILRLSVQFERDLVTQAFYKVRGCTASIAAGSALTQLLWGRTRQDLAKLKARDIEDALGGLPPESKHATVLCLDAVKAVLMK